VNRRTDGDILDQSFGISFLRTGAPTEIFRIDHLVFRFCEQAHRRRYFGSIIWYFVFANRRTDGGISDRSFGISLSILASRRTDRAILGELVLIYLVFRLLQCHLPLRSSGRATREVIPC
jgi:hypothetical protein